MAIIRTVEAEVVEEKPNKIDSLVSNNVFGPREDSYANLIPIPEPVSLSLRSEAEEVSIIVVEEANSIVVNSDTSREIAYNFTADKVKHGLAIIDQLFDPNIKRWHEGHKAALDDKKKLAKPFLDAERIVKNKMIAYDIDKRNKAKEEQRLLLADLQRIAEERASEKVIDLLSNEDEDSQLKATRLMDKLADGEIKPLASIPTIEPKGLQGSRVLTRFRVVDKSKLNIDYLIADEKLIQSVIDSKGEEACKIVGEGAIELYEIGSVAVRKK